MDFWSLFISFTSVIKKSSYEVSISYIKFWFITRDQLMIVNANTPNFKTQKRKIKRVKKKKKESLTTKKK